MAYSRKIKSSLLAAFLPVTPYLLGFGFFVFFISKFSKFFKSAQSFSKSVLTPENDINNTLSSIGVDVAFDSLSLARELHFDLTGFNFLPRHKTISIFNKLNEVNFPQFLLDFKQVNGYELYDKLQSEITFMINRFLVEKAIFLYKSVGVDFKTFLFSKPF